MNYFWIRVYDYQYDRDDYNKGILLDEFYIKGEDITREEAKTRVINKYNSIGQVMKFSKPRKKNGIYSIVMQSDKFYYDYFSKEIDTCCFHCHQPIKGMWRQFPRIEIQDKEYYFCSYDCKNKLQNNLRYEGEFQSKEKVNEKIIGYIYHMYNKTENKHYIGQTKYLPFFRWQEHIKEGKKGDITDLVFDVITEVRCSNEENPQKVLNNIEAWWINKYIEEGYEIYNVSIPKLSIEDYQRKFDDMIKNI